ncbi:MAG TPA: AzlC family ABC transporter permease [Actinomycetota bacterium]|nr:AzlC family ABC transporter permease [Actinomycetota bacterium]
MTHRNPRTKLLLRALAIGAATGAFGISFGVFCTATGLSVAQASALSLLVFTGASQFAAVGVIASAGSPITAVGSGLLLGVRNAAYGLAVENFLPKRTVPRIFASQLIIDESVALAFSADEDDRLHAFLAGGVSVFVFWNTGTLVGAIAGSNIADPAAFGIDVAFPASLLALLAPRLRDRAALRTALFGAAIAVALTPLLPPGLPIIAASLAVVLELLRTRER